MFHPVGSQPPAVYWRRRLVLSAFLVAAAVLAVLTVHAAASSGGGGPSAAAAGTTGSAGPKTTDPPPSGPKTHHHTRAAKHAGPTHTSVTKSAAPAPSGTRPSAGSSSPAGPCQRSQLSVTAVTDQKSYSVGDDPVLMIQVSNRGPEPCVQDLADRQIVLRVYNGESRVWGSHDCQIQPGTDDRTLEVGRPVRRSIVWSGLSSQPKCAGIRQRVGAGTYTLYASLSGKTGTATQFSIS